MLKIRINHTHLSKIKKKKKKKKMKFKKKWKKSDNIQTQECCFAWKTKRRFYCIHVVHEQKFRRTTEVKK